MLIATDLGGVSSKKENCLPSKLGNTYRCALEALQLHWACACINYLHQHVHSILEGLKSSEIRLQTRSCQSLLHFGSVSLILCFTMSSCRGYCFSHLVWHSVMYCQTYCLGVT